MRYKRERKNVRESIRIARKRKRMKIHRRRKIKKRRGDPGREEQIFD